MMETRARVKRNRAFRVKRKNPPRAESSAISASLLDKLRKTPSCCRDRCVKPYLEPCRPALSLGFPAEDLVFGFLV